MKKTVLLSLLGLLILFGCVAIKQQNTDVAHVPKYIRFQEFNGDTVAFIKYNFEARKQYYIGKKLKVLLNDMSLPVEYCLLSNNYLKYNGKGVYGSGAFLFSDESTYSGNLYTAAQKNIYGCSVSFAPPYVVDDPILSSLRKYGNIWNKDSRVILEHAIISDVKFFKYEGSGVIK